MDKKKNIKIIIERDDNNERKQNNKNSRNQISDNTRTNGIANRCKIGSCSSNAGGLGILGPSAGQTTMTPSPQETMENEFFEEWFREILLRDIEKLGKRVLIVMDNARFHRKNMLEKIIKETGHCLLFLPPYSPDLNPIEKLWANMKKKLKDIAHNFNTLEEAVTSVLFNKLVQF